MSDKKYNLAIAKDINDKKLTQVQMTWDEIITKLKTPVKTHETVEQYKKLDKDSKTTIKDCGGFIAGTLNGGSRKINDVLSRDLVVLDADFATPSTEHDIDRIIEYDALI